MDIPGDRTVVSFADRIMNPYLFDILMVRHIIDCLDQHQTHTSLISLMPCLTCRRLKPEHAVSLQLFCKLLKLSINKYQDDVILIIFLIFPRNLQISRPFRVFSHHSVNLHVIHFPVHRYLPVFLLL